MLDKKLREEFRDGYWRAIGKANNDRANHSMTILNVQPALFSLSRYLFYEGLRFRI